LQLAGWLLSLELVGAVLLVTGVGIAIGRIEPLAVFAVACVVGVVWTLPNAIVFYTQRRKFAEPDTKKPGL